MRDPARYSSAEYREMSEKPKRSKYGAKRMCVDGVWFDSIAEAKFYGTLQMRKRAGEVGSWGRDIDPCVNDGEVCQGCIVRAAEMDA